MECNDTFGFELAHLRNNFLSSLFDVTEPHWTQNIHVLLQHLCTTARHDSENVVPERFACSLEGDREDLAIYAFQKLANTPCFHFQEIFKDKHQLADFSTERRI